MIQEPDINASSNTSSRLIHKAGLYHPEGKCGIKNHIDQVGFKNCQNGSGIQKPEERQPTYRGFKDLMIESGIQKPYCAVDVPHSRIQKLEGWMCCRIQKPHGWEFNPTYKRIQKLNHGKWDSKTTLCNGYCTFQDSKTRRRTCTAGFKNRISGILNPHMGGFKYLIMESGIQKRQDDNQ